MGYLDLAREALKDKGRILDGHKVDRVIWETDKAIVFEDAEGRFWRYLREGVAGHYRGDEIQLKGAGHGSCGLE
jgi:hypothetical protein